MRHGLTISQHVSAARLLTRTISVLPHLEISRRKQAGIATPAYTPISLKIPCPMTAAATFHSERASWILTVRLPLSSRGGIRQDHHGGANAVQMMVVRDRADRELHRRKHERSSALSQRAHSSLCPVRPITGRSGSYDLNSAKRTVPATRESGSEVSGLFSAGPTFDRFDYYMQSRFRCFQAIRGDQWVIVNIISLRPPKEVPDCLRQPLIAFCFPHQRHLFASHPHSVNPLTRVHTLPQGQNFCSHNRQKRIRGRRSGHGCLRVSREARIRNTHVLSRDGICT